MSPTASDTSTAAQDQPQPDHYTDRVREARQRWLGDRAIDEREEQPGA